jgi:CO/xanthine dehydrogenase Mo-binding subunit
MRVSIIGQAISRVDGPLTVTGRATYGYEHWEAGQPLYGFILGATIGRGHITGIDTSRAEYSPGVRLVVTHRNAPQQGTDQSHDSMYWHAFPVLSGTEIHHYGEPVALVVATTLEQARAAANSIAVEYTTEPGNFDFAARQDHAYAPKVVNAWMPTDSAVGDFHSGFAAAPVKVDQTSVAIAHEVNMYTSSRSEYAEQTATTACGLYTAPNRLTSHRLTPLDLPRGEDVRAPGEAPGLAGIESAMDELAYQLRIDPVELRIQNEPEVHPESGIPF